MPRRLFRRTVSTSNVFRPARIRRGHGVDDPPSVGLAIAKFAAGGVVALLVLGTIGVLALARIGREEAIRDAKNLTEVVGRDVVQPQLTDALLRGDATARARVDRTVRTRVLGGDFTRVKIWSPSGTILYSDAPALVGAPLPRSTTTIWRSSATAASTPGSAT